MPVNAQSRRSNIYQAPPSDRYVQSRGNERCHQHDARSRPDVLPVRQQDDHGHESHQIRERNAPDTRLRNCQEECGQQFDETRHAVELAGKIPSPISALDESGTRQMNDGTEAKYNRQQIRDSYGKSTAQHNNLRSARGDVSVAQYIRLRLEILQPVLDDVA